MTDQTASTVEAPTQPATSPSPTWWVYRPALDLLVGGGAWSLPLLLLAYWLGRTHPTGISIVFYVLALVVNYPHYMATIYRAYHKREDFSKYKVYTQHLTAVLLLTILLTHFSSRILPWVFTLYVTWNPWHYTSQNFGLALMCARRAGANPTARVRNALSLAFFASYLMLLCSLNSGAVHEPYVLSMGLPARFERGVVAVMLVVFAVCGIWGLRSLVRQTSLRAMQMPIVLFTTQFIWFALPTIIKLSSRMQFPLTYYSTGVLAVLHAAQYLWVAGYYARREAQCEEASTWRPWGYFGMLVVGGIALFVPWPWVVSYAFHYDFVTSFLIFSSLINIHHFLLDGALWKLRDKRIAALLIGGQQAFTLQVKQVKTVLGHWMTGSGMARPLRLTAAVLLVLFAGVDQARFYFGLDEKNPSNLVWAARLNPYDATVQLHLAQTQAQTGNMGRAISALQQAVRVNPYLADAQNSLGQVLIGNQRFEEAYEHYKRMKAYLPANVEGLINFGILAVRLGHDDEAAASWERALLYDPKQPVVRLYLADAYERQGRFAQAIPHYERYLASVLDPSSGQSDPKQVIAIALKIAQDYVRISNPDLALKYYEKVIPLAEKAGEKSLQSLALARSGDLYAEINKRVEAAICYQRVLALDAASGDTRAEGMDWFNYGQFLKQCEAPWRMVLACYLRAEDLLKPTPGSELDSAVKFRQEMEAAAGSDAAEVRRNVKTLSEQALAYKIQ